MSRYKDHPIYGVAVPAPENQWYSRGLVFDRDLNQTIEIKRIESNRRTFKTKKQAEHTDSICVKHGLTSGLDDSLSRGYRCLDYVWHQKTR